MTRRTLIILALAALAQAAYLLVEGHGQSGTDVEQSRARRLLPGLDPQRVKRVSLQRKGEARIELLRAAEGWRLTQPLQDRADQARVEELLAALEFADHVRILPEDFDGRKLGLGAPRLVLTVGAPHEEQILSIGEDDPTGRGIYVDLNGRRMVAERALYEVLNRGGDELRERDLWPLGVGQIQRVELGGMALTRGGGGWMIKAEGITARAEPAEASRLLSALAGLRAARFVSPPEKPPRSRISIDGPGNRLELRYGAACPGRPTETLVVQEGQPRRSFCMAREDLAGLRHEARELIDPVLTHLGEADAQKVQLAGAPAGITLVRDGGYWKITPDLRADDQRLRSWFLQLGAARAEVEVPPASRIEEILAHPRVRVTLVAQTGTRESLVVGRPVGGRTPVVREGENILLWFPSSAVKAFHWGKTELRSHQIFDFSPLDVQRVTTVRGREREVMIRQNDTWQVAEPVKSRADAAHARELIRRLSRLRVERFLEPSPFDAGITLTIQLRPGAPAVGPASGEGRSVALELDPGGSAEPWVGRMSGAPPFLLSAADSALLARRRADLTLLQIDDGSLQEVVVTDRSRRLEAIKRGYSWVDHQGRQLSAARMAQLLGLLRGLKAQEITGYGALRLAPWVTVKITHAGDSSQEVRVDSKGRAVVTGRPVGYLLPPAQVAALNGFLAE